MVKIKLSDLMGKYKKSQKDIVEATGIHHTTISKLYHETIVRIDVSHIDKLCKFFNCKSQDLIEYIPDED